MKLVYVRTLTLSCMVRFENNLIQMIIMTKQYVMNKNHVYRLKIYDTICTYTLCIDFSETCSRLPITWSSMLGFINNLAQTIIMRRGCVANKMRVTSSKFKFINHT